MPHRSNRVRPKVHSSVKQRLQPAPRAYRRSPAFLLGSRKIQQRAPGVATRKPRRFRARPASEVHVPVKPSYKSFRYKANVAWSGARRGTLAAAGKPDIVVGSPPEFKGEPQWWSPEELLIGSLNTCLLLTFLTLAQARGVTPVSYESEADGLVENSEGKYRVTAVTVRPSIVVKEQADLEMARKVMENVESHCFISNSITAKVTLDPVFSVAPRSA
jgi:organic hydroperoxide reductase OsmC/OhrA